MNKEIELLELLKNNKGYKEEKFLKIMDKCKTLSSAVCTYKKKLLQETKVRDDDIEITKENIESLFLEPLNNMRFKYIKEAIQINKWTIKDLFEKCQRLDMSIMMVVGIRNERASF